MTLDKIAAVLAVLGLIPSLVRRPTLQLVARYRELREAAVLDLATQAARAGAIQAVAERHGQEVVP